MKTLVIANKDDGVWLAEHLGCTLYDRSCAGDGIVTKVDSIADVWDKIIYLCDDIAATPNAVGRSLLGDKIWNDAEYGATVMLGEGLRLTTDADDGLDVGIMGWWNKEWLGKPTLVIEQNNLMNRDLGVELTSPAGLTVLPVDVGCNLMVNTLGNVTRTLHNYEGPVCMRVCVQGSMLSVSSLKLGFEYGWLECCMELQRGNLMEMPLNLTDNVAVAVLVSIPPYPYESDATKGVQIVANDMAVKHMRLLDVYRTKENGLMSAGQTGRLFYATAWGTSPKEARMRIYRSLRGINVKHVQYRTDISSVADNVIEQLTLLKWI